MKLTNKRLIKVYFVLIVLTSSITFLYGQSKKINIVEDGFKVTVIDSDYSQAYSTFIVLTSKRLDVIFKGELVGEKDSLLFSTWVRPSDTLKQISNFDIRELKNNYSNDCISDGSQITVDVKKGRVNKTVHLSNYYQEDIGKIIHFINSHMPDKYQVAYDKKQLKAYEKLCTGVN